MPRKKLHSFLKHTLTDSARIDFYRGGPHDDLVNWLWSQWFQRCPGYQGRLQLHNLSVCSQGNAMEWVAGIAFAAATDCQHVPPTAGALDFETRWDWHDWRPVAIASSKHAWAKA